MKYRTIVVDPPWQYVIGPSTGLRGTAEAHYPTMTMKEIMALPVADLAADDAHLYMWVTNPILTEQRTQGISAPDIARAWGFEPKTLITWDKQSMGLGFYWRGLTEHVLFGVRGKLPIEPEKRIANLFRSPRQEHSQKPEAFLDLVEQVSPGPYLEIFARRQRLGWDTWGNESLEHVAMK